MQDTSWSGVSHPPITVIYHQWSDEEETRLKTGYVPYTQSGWLFCSYIFQFQWSVEKTNVTENQNISFVLIFVIHLIILVLPSVESSCWGPSCGILWMVAVCMVAELRGGRAWPSESGHLATSAPSPSSLYSETPPLLYTGDGGHRAQRRSLLLGPSHCWLPLLALSQLRINY